MENYIDLLAMLGIEDAHPGGFQLTKQVLSLLSISPNTQVLEVGCGHGKTAIYLKKVYDCQVSAIEINNQMLLGVENKCKLENVQIQLKKGLAEQIPFTSNLFDIVLSESVTAFTNIDSSLKEYVRVLKNNGIFIAIEMTVERVLSQIEQFEIMRVYGVKKILLEEEWKDYLYRSGFADVQIIGGTTIMNTTSAVIPPMSIHKLSNQLQKLFFEHQRILQKYRNILGYRVFLCKK